MKPIEIVLEKKPWDGNGKKTALNKIVGIRVAYGEIQTRSVIKAAGGRWNKEEKVWELPYQEVLALGLKSRMVKK